MTGHRSYVLRGPNLERSEKLLKRLVEALPARTMSGLRRRAPGLSAELHAHLALLRADPDATAPANRGR